VDRVAYTWFIYHIDLPEQPSGSSSLTGSESDFKPIATRLIGPESPDRNPVPGELLKPVIGREPQPTRLLSAPVTGNEPEEPPVFNVLLITIDTLRSDHLGCYGHPLGTSPRLDRLSQRSLMLTAMRCGIPQTTPSHASLFTGLTPGRHGSHITACRSSPISAS
jgi:hypothetical protein